MDRKSACAIYQALNARYPRIIEGGISYGGPFEVLVLTILSAQTTDRTVAAVGPLLFSRYPTPGALAAADPDEVEEIIRPTGFYRVKARHIIGAARMIVDECGGEVPRTLQGLTRLPGVGRKTANIVLSNACGTDEGIAVDTHVRRISRLLGLTDETDPEKVERDLTATFPREVWGDINAFLVQHGRAICIARRPRCEECMLTPWCRYFREEVQGSRGAKTR
ncbi:endonuclease III [Methanofollis formosanus]|uniref:Endonuclease III n=1 Tax=Methanofollis formosanus TaxID=299308 RepID=A0A8G1A1D7_9EURY|nr:endonuclease III [Methanofollis formosanus]QYZ78609.1 endonuclease III [Methanofollis formosanus]